MKYVITYNSVINGKAIQGFENQDELVKFINTIHYLDGEIISIKIIDINN